MAETTLSSVDIPRRTTLVDPSTGVEYSAVTADLLPAALTASGNFKTAVREALPAGANTIGSVNVTSSGHSASVTITRPADTTAYDAGDAIGDTGGSAILHFANMAKAGGGEVMITSIEFEVDVSAVPSGMAGFKARLYNAAPTAIADNAAWDLIAGDRGKYLGVITLGTPVDEGATLFIDNDQLNKQITLPGTDLYVVLQTVGGFTPSSEAVKRLTIHTRDI